MRRYYVDLGLALRRAPGGEEQTLLVYDAEAGTIALDTTAASLDDTYYLAVIAVESRALLGREELQALGGEARIERVVRAIRARRERGLEVRSLQDYYSPTEPSS